MDLSKANQLAREKLSALSPIKGPHKGASLLDFYDFKFNDSKRACGLCETLPVNERRFRWGTIYLSRQFVISNKDEDILDTILHEGAHALFHLEGWQEKYVERAGKTVRDIHGPAWKKIAARVGARPKACAPFHVTIPKHYAIMCPKCGKIGEAERRRRLVGRICRRCKSSGLFLALNTEYRTEKHAFPEWEF